MNISLSDIDPDVLTILSAIIAIGISQSRNANELNVLGNFIVGVGGLILTEAAVIDSQNAKKADKEKIQEIHRQIDQLKRDLAEIERNNC